MTESTDEIPRYPYLRVALRADEVEEAGDTLFELGATGLEERDQTTLDRNEGAEVNLIAHFATEDDAREALAEIGGRFAAELAYIVGDDWRDKWKAFFKPTRVGERLVIRPSWEAFAAQPHDVIVTLDPGQAFGTGTHESTRLVLKQIERVVRGGERVLDVGCGSGILAIAALKLGAASARAIDIDPIAARVTTENAEVNGVTIDASAAPIGEVDGVYDLVLANIRAPILIPMAEELLARRAPGGALVLSGLLTSEEAEVRAAYASAGEAIAEADGDWLALTFRDRP